MKAMAALTEITIIINVLLLFLEPFKSLVSFYIQDLVHTKLKQCQSLVKKKSAKKSSTVSFSIGLPRIKNIFCPSENFYFIVIQKISI